MATASAPRRDDEEDVDDREHRLEHQLEHHRDREQQDRAADRSVGVIAMRPGERFANREPETAPRFLP